MTELIDVRCPLPRKDNSAKPCNCLCVQVAPGSSGMAYCRRHDTTFEFQVDGINAFSGILSTREAIIERSDRQPEHP